MIGLAFDMKAYLRDEKGSRIAPGALNVFPIQAVFGAVLLDSTANQLLSETVHEEKLFGLRLAATLPRN